MLLQAQQSNDELVDPSEGPLRNLKSEGPGPWLGGQVLVSSVKYALKAEKSLTGKGPSHDGNIGTRGALPAGGVHGTGFGPRPHIADEHGDHALGICAADHAPARD